MAKRKRSRKTKKTLVSSTTYHKRKYPQAYLTIVEKEITLEERIDRKKKVKKSKFDAKAAEIAEAMAKL